MAKRLKLDKQASDPDLNKLKKLDNDMGNVIQTDDKSVADKLKEYEELLAQYRETLEKLARQTSKSLDVDVNDAKDYISAALHEEGVKTKGDRVYIPLDSYTRKRQKKAATPYSQRTYEKALKYMSSKNHMDSANDEATSRLALKLFNIIRNKINVSDYPIMQKMFGESDVSFSGKWARL